MLQVAAAVLHVLAGRPAHSSSEADASDPLPTACMALAQLEQQQPAASDLVQLLVTAEGWDGRMDQAMEVAQAMIQQLESEGGNEGLSALLKGARQGGAWPSALQLVAWGVQTKLHAVGGAKGQLCTEQVGEGAEGMRLACEFTARQKSILRSCEAALPQQ